MSWLRSAGSPLGHGTRHLWNGSLVAPARGAPSSAASQAWRIVEDHRTPQISDSIIRSFGTQRAPKNSGQGSRFQRSSVSSAETPADAAGEGSQAQPNPTSLHPAPTPLSAPSARPDAIPQTGSRMPPPARKPVDTSSKEYKKAASRYVRFVVAFPLLIVTSYFLYDRLAKDLDLRIRQVPAGSSPSQEPSAER